MAKQTPPGERRRRAAQYQKSAVVQVGFQAVQLCHRPAEEAVLHAEQQMDEKLVFAACIRTRPER